MKIVVAATLAVLALAAPGCANDDSAMSTGSDEDPASAPSRRAETLACLREHGATVTPLRPSDRELRALRDLAQGDSVEVRLDGATVAMAFAEDVGGAQLLVELLTVPDGAYEIVRSGNVVVLHRPSAGAGLAAVTDCLEP